MTKKALSVLRLFIVLNLMICPLWTRADSLSIHPVEMTTLRLKAANDPSSAAESTESSLTAPIEVDSAGNYAFSTATSGSLVDMSSGTTTLIAADQDDVASAVTLIGFDFYFQGVRQDRFSVNSNGSLRFGTTTISTTLYDPLGQSGQSLISAFGSDQRTHAGNGKVHFKVTGSEPNRALIVEWLNMQSDFNAGGTADLTYQLRLNETTGTIEYLYGTMAMSANAAADPNSLSPQFGFSSNNSAGTIGTITAAQSGSPDPSFDGSAASPVNNTYVTGSISVLSSVADGSRRSFTLTPTPVNPPGGPLTFTGVSATSTTLNWADLSNEIGYAIYASTDATNYSFINIASMDATSFTASGLTGATTYTWRVYAITEGSAAFISGVQTTDAPTANISVGSGLWSSPAIWSTGVVPTGNDTVSIGAGTTVTIDTAAAAYSISVAGFGTLEFEQTTARTLSVATDVSIQSDGILRSNSAGTQTGHVLSLGGNLTNDGILDLSTNADTAGAGITFTGATNNVFAGTGVTTDIRAITVNKGVSNANILELSPTNFTVRGVTTDTVVGGWLVLTNGTLKVSGTFAGTSRVFAAAAYTIPATGGFWLNNPNYQVAAQNGNAVNNGLLQISQGTFNQGTLNTANMTGGAGAVFTIDGGNVNLAGRFNPSSAIRYNQSAGSFNVATVGNTATGTTNGSFTIPVAATFNMTGGTIRLVQASTGSTPIDYINSSGTILAANGTLQAGSSATATNFNFRLRGYIPNLVVDNSVNNKTVTATGQINLLGSTTITSGASMVINGQICLVLGPTFTNNGTLTGTAASTRFYFLGGRGATTYNGSGVVTAPLTAFEIDNTAGVTIDPAVNPIIVARLNNFTGGLTNANKLTIGNGGSTSGTVQLGVSGAIYVVDGLDATPVFNPGTGGVIMLYAPEITRRTTGPEMPPARILTTLNITNPNGLTIAGGDVTVNGAGSGALALGTARVITGSNTLYFNSAAGTVTRTTGYVDGNFKKLFPASASKTFEVGSANGYSPVDVNVTAGTFPADVTVSAVQSAGPSILPADKAITRYWNIIASGITATLTLNYLDPLDIPGTVTESNLHLYRLDGTTYTDLGGTVDTTANTAVATGVGTFGNFTLAEAGAIYNVHADLSITNTDGVASVNTGGALTYSIVATNSGPEAVVGASVTDTLPSDLACSWTCAGSGGATCTASGSGDIADTVDLPVAASAIYTVTCTVATTSLSASLSNTATIAAPVNVTESSLANNSATDTDTLVRLVDLSVSKSDGLSALIPGTAVTYHIVVGNAGPNVSPTLTTDNLPARLTGCSWTCSAVSGSCGVSGGSGNIADTGALNVGGTLTYTVGCTVAPDAVGALTNTATVATGDASVSDTNSANNSATDTDSMVNSDVTVTITDHREFVRIGQSLNYIITLTNATGPDTAIASVVDMLPAELDGGSWTCIPFGGASCSSGLGNSLSDSVSLPVGSQVSYVYSATVLGAGPGGVIANSASATVAGDTNPADNTATDAPTDKVVILHDGFDGPDTSSIIITVENADVVSGNLRVNAALVDQLSLEPLEVAQGQSAGGQGLFGIELAQFNDDRVMRVVTRDSSGLNLYSPWRTLEAERNAIEFAWQPASDSGADGYVRLSAGAAPIQVDGLANTARLTGLRITTKNAVPWLLGAPTASSGQ